MSCFPVYSCVLTRTRRPVKDAVGKYTLVRSTHTYNQKEWKNLPARAAPTRSNQLLPLTPDGHPSRPIRAPLRRVHLPLSAALLALINCKTLFHSSTSKHRIRARSTNNGFVFFLVWYRLRRSVISGVERGKKVLRVVPLALTRPPLSFEPQMCVYSFYSVNTSKIN
jgi:hypothetical protein